MLIPLFSIPLIFYMNHMHEEKISYSALIRKKYFIQFELISRKLHDILLFCGRIYIKNYCKKEKDRRNYSLFFTIKNENRLQ